MMEHSPPYVVQNEDLSDPWNDTAWVTTADGLTYIAGEMTPQDARFLCDALNEKAAMNP